MKNNYMKRTFVRRSDVERELETFLEAQDEITHSNNPFAIKQKTRARSFLEKEVALIN